MRMEMISSCSLVAPFARRWVFVAVLAALLASPGLGGLLTIEADSDALTFRIGIRPGQPVSVVALPPHTQPTAGESRGAVVWSGTVPDHGAVRIARFAEAADRLFNRFAMVDAEGTLLGPPQWATKIEDRQAGSFAFHQPASKKGLACIIDYEDALALGIAHAAKNITLGQLISLDSERAAFHETVDGHRIGIDGAYVAKLDRSIKRLTDAGVNVTAVLINPMGMVPGEGNPLRHPDAAEGGRNALLSAFNTASAEGLRHYRAALQFLMGRYSSPQEERGWISGYVIGNEINAHWVWNNQGEAEDARVLNDYSVAVRSAWMVAQQFHAAKRIYVSLEHHWTLRGHGHDPRRFMAGKTVLEELAERSRVEGDFPWHVAFHPYPESLFRPAFWRDRTAPLHPDAFRITFRNLEVLDAFLRQPEMTYAGTPRRIALTEQGFHSGDNPESSEEVQAAAFALAYWKVERMELVDQFIYHRHIDHPKEGGLNLGLRRTLSREAEVPGEKKRIWEAFRVADTADAEEANRFSLAVAGLADWSEIGPAAMLDEHGIRPSEDTVFDFFRQISDAAVDRALAFHPEYMLKAGGWQVPGIYHHPRNDGPTTARWTVELPTLDEGERLMLEFATALRSARSTDGVVFAIAVEQEALFSREQQAPEMVERSIDISRWAGRTVEFLFSVDPRASNDYDQSLWVEPRIRRSAPGEPHAEPAVAAGAS
jgi:hypothetical protein